MKKIVIATGLLTAWFSGAAAGTLDTVKQLEAQLEQAKKEVELKRMKEDQLSLAAATEAAVALLKADGHSTDKWHYNFVPVSEPDRADDE